MRFVEKHDGKEWIFDKWLQDNCSCSRIRMQTKIWLTCERSQACILWSLILSRNLFLVDLSLILTATEWTNFDCFREKRSASIWIVFLISLKLTWTMTEWKACKLKVDPSYNAKWQCKLVCPEKEEIKSWAVRVYVRKLRYLQIEESSNRQMEISVKFMSRAEQLPGGFWFTPRTLSRGKDTVPFWKILHKTWAQALIDRSRRAWIQ